MNMLPNKLEWSIMAKDGLAVISSKKVAEIFGKKHADIWGNIRDLCCSDEFRSDNFCLNCCINQHHLEEPYYSITRDGFVMLTMGFTGKESNRVREEYIQKLVSLEEDSLSSNLFLIDFSWLTIAASKVHS